MLLLLDQKKQKLPPSHRAEQRSTVDVTQKTMAPCLLQMFENRVLRRIFGPETEEVAGGWRRLHNEELHNLYATPNVIRVMGSRRMRWDT
jgi:hypothetical protein